MNSENSQKSTAHGHHEWNAVYTRHQHEKSVADSLAGNGFETFLPTYNTIRQWTDRKKQLRLPLFPCYVFVRGNFERRFRIIMTPGVHSMVMFGARPAVISDAEVDAIRRAVDSKLAVEPHPFLQCGDWVRVTSGPLTDVEGILVRKKTSYRLILSAQLLGKSIAVEIDAFSVKPISRRSPALLTSAGRPESFADRRLAG
jgi:transcription antitermination factor NusG